MKSTIVPVKLKQVKEIFIGKRNYFTIYRVSLFMWSIVRGVILTGVCFMVLYPTLLRLSVSLMHENDLYDLTVRYVPRTVTFDNVLLVWRMMDYPGTFFNTLKLSLLTSILQLASCTVIGYGFARFKFWGKSFIFSMVVVTLVVPPQTVMVPLFLHFRFFDIFGLLSIGLGQGINLLDSYWPFVLLSSTGLGLRNGLYIYIMRQFFRGMPKELEEAAYVDGAGLFRTFFEIMLPSAVPAMVTIFLFSFVWQWTDVFYSSLFLRDLRVFSSALSGLSYAIAQLRTLEMGGLFTVFLNPAVASMYNNVGSLMITAPLMFLYLFVQRHFVESIDRAGIVG